MKAHLAYLRYLLRHKWYVFLECWRAGIPLLGIIHDWSKFLSDEWYPYVQTFYKPDGSPQYEETLDFAVAWNHHQKRNKHHWQYWLDCDIITAKCTISSEEYCQCLAQSPSLSSSANSADTNALERILSTAGWCVIYAGSIIKSIIAQKCDGKTINPKHPNRSRVFTNTDANNKNDLVSNRDVGFSSTTAETRPVAPAVARRFTSSWHSITSMVTESNTAKKTQKAWGGEKPTTGQSATTFPPSSEFSATIAIQHLASMAIVPIRETRILIWDRGNAECLSCGKPFPVENLIPRPMPENYRQEMLADWRGAGRALGKSNNTAVWYRENKDKMCLHPETRDWIESQLVEDAAPVA